MRVTALFSTLFLVGQVAAHTRLLEVWVNGVDKGDGRTKYIRSPPNDDPVKDLASPAMACNVNSGPAPEFVSAAAGDKLTLEWYHERRGDFIIDKSHQGPVITYIAPYTAGDGSGAIWSKIAEDGYDGSVWGVGRLIQNVGKVDVTLPSALAPGKYLLRQEIIAHHESDYRYDQNPAAGAQFYPVCVQLEVSGSGTAVPNQNFDFNTGYTYSDPGIFFDLYTSYSSYKIPGPAIWNAAAAGGGSGSGSGTGTGTGTGTGSGSGTGAAPPVVTPVPVDTPADPPAPVPTTLVTVPSQPGSATQTADRPAGTTFCNGRWRKTKGGRRKCRGAASSSTSSSSSY